MLELQEQTVKQLALSLNHENAGDEKVPYLSVKYTEVQLKEVQVDALLGKYTWRSWFNVNGTDIQPMEWTKKVDLTCKDAFKEVAVTKRVNGNTDLEFEGCRLYFDDFKLLSGGLVMADIHIHIIKHKENDMIQIRRAEFTEVTLSLGDGVLIERTARKQRQLPFEADSEADELTKDVLPESHPPLTGGHLAGTQNDPQMHVWWQHGITGEQSNGLRRDLPEGCVEIDPPAGCKTEAAQVSAEQAKASGSPDDLAAFESGVAKAVGARKKRGSNVIDGRSERVKHQDRQAGRDDTH